MNRAPGWIALGFLAALCAALGTWWWSDRGRNYERPRWDLAAFERIGTRLAEATPDRETWVVVVNPACPHCMTTLAEIADTLGATPVAPHLFALIVDATSRPDDRAVTHPRLDGVYWDRRQVWRSRWGHRMYGELMRFDAAGEWIAGRHRAG